MNRRNPEVWYVVGGFSIGFGGNGIWIRDEDHTTMKIKYESFEKWLKLIWDKEF